MKDKNINISSWNKIWKIWDTLFELKQIEVFILQEAAASGNNIEKESQKPRPKLKIYIF